MVGMEEDLINQSRQVLSLTRKNSVWGLRLVGPRGLPKETTFEQRFD